MLSTQFKKLCTHYRFLLVRFPSVTLLSKAFHSFNHYQLILVAILVDIGDLMLPIATTNFESVAISIL